MWRDSGRARITVRPVVEPRARRTFETSAPDSASFSKLISPKASSPMRDKTHAAAEHGEVVRENGGRAPERQRQAAGQKFALGRERLRQPIENQVEVQFADDRDVKARHAR